MMWSTNAFLAPCSWEHVAYSIFRDTRFLSYVAMYVCSYVCVLIWISSYSFSDRMTKLSECTHLTMSNKMLQAEF